MTRLVLTAIDDETSVAEAYRNAAIRKELLVEQKPIKRALRILHRRGKLSEEKAYLLMRNNCRRRRIPIADLANEIIEANAQRKLLRNCPMG